MAGIRRNGRETEGVVVHKTNEAAATGTSVLFCVDTGGGALQRHCEDFGGDMDDGIGTTRLM